MQQLPGAEMAPPAQAVWRREPIITLRMDQVAEELRQEKQERARSGAVAPTAARTPESLLRCAAACRFLCTCVLGSAYSMAPPTLAAAEAACILAIYWAAVPNAVPTHSRQLHYSFQGSAEDVVALSLLRCASVTLAHCLGAGPQFQRPYRLTALLFAAVSLPLGLMKMDALRHSQWEHRQWPPFIALYAVHMACAVAQVLAAQRIVSWARKRWEHGLGGLGYPWEQGEDTWLLAGQLQAQAEEGRGGGYGDDLASKHDVPAAQLADADSRWAQCGELRIHYKLALPLGFRGSAGAGTTGIVLIHSFGGGTFAWRHLMQPLADACGLPVLAFDRPGFGLTDRPRLAPGTLLDDNPYSLKYQALLTLQLASTVGLQRVVLTGHGDGAMLALMSAAMAARGAAMGSSSSPSHPSSPRDGRPLEPTAASLSRPLAGARQRTAPVLAGPWAVGSAHRRRGSAGSVPDGLDWAWMSSVPEGGHSLLQQLLRGEWPASIEPRMGPGLTSSGSLTAGWPGARSPTVAARRCSPLRPRGAAGRGQQDDAGGGVMMPAGAGQLATSGQLEAFQEEEGEQEQQQRVARQLSMSQPLPDPQQAQQQPDQRQQAAQQAQQTQALAASATTEQGGGVWEQPSGLIDNPSFLSQPSTATSGQTELAGEGWVHQQSSFREQGSMIDNPSFLSQPASTNGTEAAGEGALHQDTSFREQGGLVDNPSFLSQPSTTASGSAEASGLPDQHSGLIDNASFLSQTSNREPWEHSRHSTEEGSAAPPVVATSWQRQQGRAAWQAGGRGLDSEEDPNFLATVEEEDVTEGGELGEGLEGDEAEGRKHKLLAGPHGLWTARPVGCLEAEVAAAAAAHGIGQLQLPPVQGQQARGQTGAGVEEISGIGGGADSGWMWQAPEPVGLILLHPDLSGTVAPKYARVLAHSRLGRRVLRSLLRTEVGEVTNRRAFADPQRHLTPELLALYRRPLRVLGWDLALTEVARVRNDIHSLERTRLLDAVVQAGLPVMVATGEADHMVPPSAVSRIAERLGAVAPRLAVLPLSGHLSHEEAPHVLLDFLASFVLELGLGAAA